MKLIFRDIKAANLKFRLDVYINTWNVAGGGGGGGGMGGGSERERERIPNQFFKFQCQVSQF